MFFSQEFSKQENKRLSNSKFINLIIKKILKKNLFLQFSFN